MTTQTPLPHAVELLTELRRMIAEGPVVVTWPHREALLSLIDRIAATPAQAAPEAVRRLSSAELEVATEDGRRTWANAIGGDECLDVAKAVEAACWVRYAVPSRQLVSVSSIDVERMIAECVPGGDICDHQHVADAIRRYCDAWPSDTPSEAVPSPSTAQRMGEVGGPVHDGERLAFEAWMRGHCWALCATWDGKQYRSDAEKWGDVDPHAVRTRQLWAAWRDRAALGADAIRSLQQEVERLRTGIGEIAMRLAKDKNYRILGSEALLALLPHGSNCAPGGQPSEMSK